MGRLSKRNLLFVVLFFTCVQLSACQQVFSGGQPLEPLAEQPYSLIYNTVTGAHQARRLLIVSSADPTSSEDYRAIQQRNIYLGQIISSHWPVEVDVVQVDDYQRGMLAAYDGLFLIEDFDKVPIDVLEDIVASPDKEIIFAGYGAATLLYHVLGDVWAPASEEAITTLPLPATTLGDVTYKEVAFNSRKLQLLSVYPPLPDTDEARIDVLASYTDERGATRPLIVDVNERFLIMPFEVPYYYSTDDWTLVFLDTLHYAFGHHEPTYTALVRLEDVNPYTYRSTARLRDAYEYLQQEQIPFHIAVIARYINPQTGLDLYTHEAPRYMRYLQRMVGEGLGVIVQHGYTHQSDGISSIDYEYWDEANYSPLENDTEEFVIGTIKGAQEEMRYIRLPVPDVFETPHYALSDLDHEVISRYYPLRYEHIPDVGSLPFVAEIDDRIYFPTNLGYVATWNDIEPQEKAALLTQVSVFEDPVASFFWHPWRDVNELKYMVNLLEGKGYQFASIYDLLQASPDAGYYAIAAYRENFRPNRFALTNVIIDTLLVVVYVGFLSGSVFYLINIYRISRYYKQVSSERITMEDVRALAVEKGRELPNLGILVPARNEGYVIGNTVRRLIAMDYPKQHYRVYVIVDERELDDNVEVLTKDTAYELAAHVREETGIDLVRVIEVPRWYSGEFGNLRYSEKRSTKGRALNYCLEYLVASPEWDSLEIFGILDADGRLDPHVLKEIAHRRLKDDSKLLQGSVFQVSNYSQISIVGVAAGLELAIHHLTVLPARMLNKRVQFLAGTNYFIDKDVMMKVKGWDQSSLVEDAELALRIYVQENVIAEWIRSPELEQSPASFRVYRRQRERWARGHLLLLRDVWRAPIGLKDKLSFFVKVFMSQFRFLVDVGLIILALVLIGLGAFAYLPPFLKWLSVFLAVMSIFIMDLYGFTYRKLAGHINPNMSVWQKIKQTLILFAYFPVMVVVQAVPRLLALANFLFKREVAWYKTERTKETVIADQINKPAR